METHQAGLCLFSIDKFPVGLLADMGSEVNQIFVKSINVICYNKLLLCIDILLYPSSHYLGRF